MSILELNAEHLQNWLFNYLLEITGEPIEEMSLNDELFKYDLDSIDSITMALEMEKAFNREIQPETFLDGLTTIQEVIDIAKKLK